MMCLPTEDVRISIVYIQNRSFALSRYKLINTVFSALQLFRMHIDRTYECPSVYRFVTPFKSMLFYFNSGCP